MRTDVAALIPAYQAAATVADVVKGARAHCARVVVVDDGSDDGTEARARAAGAQVLRHASNAGKGAAILTGLHALRTRGTRFDFETEVLLRAARRGMPLLGVPVRVFYPPVAERVSHFKPGRDTLRIIGTVLRVLVLPG